uniref:Protein translocase subunit SecA n=1 Tax=Nitzschia sp. IriIs04 TaxID=1444690 RepID=A0A0S3QPR2_9STRA|nr:preprotein translocase subunit A [Nitzschia sp. IriIs04]BAT70316.1 preprotein translocase subunit A [Nitzschia sp. IriIs04]
MLFIKKITQYIYFYYLILRINLLEKHLKNLNLFQLKIKNLKLKKEYKKNHNLSNLTIRSFSITKVVLKKTLGLNYYNTQIMGALVLSKNQIAEIKTGEGKTLTSILTASLQALTNKTVTLITTTEYLSIRDFYKTKLVYNNLGLTVGLIKSTMSHKEKQLNYKKNIIYVSSNIIVFDFLKDNLIIKKKNQLISSFDFCILDEIDSILIDDSETPLILSTILKKSIKIKYKIASKISTKLKKNIHYIIDYSHKLIFLTYLGHIFIEKLLCIKQLAHNSSSWMILIVNALKVKYFYFKDIHYIIKNKKIVIINELNGRAMPEKRWNKGIHQSIEIKENLNITNLSCELSYMTYANFFSKYNSLTGMTGTGQMSNYEFKKNFKLNVFPIPLNFNSQKKELDDLLFKDKKTKFNAVITKCKELYLTGQPILIGTKTIFDSEKLASLLKNENIYFKILNANTNQEQNIIFQAGKLNSITIATNIAGRGTDIILGGENKYNYSKSLQTIYKICSYSNIFFYNILLTRYKLKNSSKSLFNIIFLLIKSKYFKLMQQKDFLLTKIDHILINLLKKNLNYYINKNFLIESNIIKTLGGLYIIGFERNYSRRIDNQLIGRCGRQGNPGISQFYISLEDDIWNYNFDLKIKNKLNKKFKNNLFLSSFFINKTFLNLQKKIEELTYYQKTFLHKYDNILLTQQNIFFKERKNILNSKNININIYKYFLNFVTNKVLLLIKYNISISNIKKIFNNEFDLKICQQIDNKKKLIEILTTTLFNKYNIKKIKLNLLKNKFTEKIILLKSIDQAWRNQLYFMKELKEMSLYLNYHKKDSFDIYKKEALKLFYYQKKTLINIIVYKLYNTLKN